MIEKENQITISSPSILIDTREKQPYQFPAGQPTSIKTLKTGDYTLAGFEDVIAVEKKRNVTEFAQSVAQKRFWRELDRMQAFPHKFLLLDFSFGELEGYPFTTDLPWYVKKKIKLRGGFLLKALARIMSKGIMVCFTGSAKNSANLLMQLFKELQTNNA